MATRDQAQTLNFEERVFDVTALFIPRLPFCYITVTLVMLVRRLQITGKAESQRLDIRGFLTFGWPERDMPPGRPIGKGFLPHGLQLNFRPDYPDVALV